MAETRTVDSILESLNKMVSEKQVLSPQLYMLAAEQLTVLIGDENDKLFQMEQAVARMKLEFLKDSKSVAEVKLKIEATDEYRQMKEQKAKIEQVTEFIRISKLQARLKNDEVKNY